MGRPISSLLKSSLDGKSGGVFSTQSNIYDGAILQNELTANVISAESSIIDILKGPKYVSGKFYTCF